ncbi:apolipoprotein N-acyltransferase [Phenylobacterium sp.]|uniref:apolipoprotein N-acyltransferase n=1 Tax=Phenylobacterium sp. TaxID=1871053 RepID=UPI0028119953|nr:apolipoprotein N-acyltransferase [Phenylobacterium sp.]
MRSVWLIRVWALLAGLAAGLAHPPFGLLPGLVGYGLILFALEADSVRPLRSGFFRGWLAGVGYFGVSTWWIVEPFLVDVKAHGWMAPFGIVAMAGGLALFWGLAGLAYRALKAEGAWKVLVFAGCFAAFEWLRGHVLTGFPWNLPGETWRAGSAPSQAAALVGAYGLTWVTLVLGASAGVLGLKAPRSEKAAALVFGLAALAGLYGYGWARLEASVAAKPAADAPLIRVVQADIDQKDKWKPENLRLIFDTYAGLTRRAAATRPDIVVWPEGALPAVIDDLLGPDSIYGPLLRDTVDQGQTLLMGANRAELAPSGDVRYFNSLVAFRREGPGLRVTGVYDKHRLVPFGEYLPLGETATKIGVRSLVHMPEDFTAGPPPRPLAPWGVPALQPLICYEALFPGFTRAGALRDGVRPAWILNISNDAWFGRTSGPLQHLNIASYRAIEEGLPIVRSTPTGVSAVIDAYGRIVPGARLGLGELGVIDARLPSALEPTLFARLGDAIFGAMLVVSALAWLAGRVRQT